MSITPVLESKNEVSPTLENKIGSSLVWNDMTMAWEEETATWDSPKVVPTLETKNSVSVTLENKL